MRGTGGVDVCSRISTHAIASNFGVDGTSYCFEPAACNSRGQHPRRIPKLLP